MIRLDDADRVNFATLGQVPVPIPGGHFVPLASVATIAVVHGPNQIGRENGKRRVMVQANVRGRDVASVVNDAKAAIAKDVRLPAGSYLEWGGQFENLASARGRLALVVPACFALILLLLYGALGSTRDAAIVFTGVPLALVGGVLAPVLRGMPSRSRPRRLHRAFGYCGAQRAGDGDVDPGSDARRDGSRASQCQRRDAAASPFRYDGAGRVAWLRPHGARSWCWSGGAEATRNRRHRGGLISATLLMLFVLPTLYALWGRREMPVSQTDRAEDPFPPAAVVLV